MMLARVVMELVLWAAILAVVLMALAAPEERR